MPVKIIGTSHIAKESIETVKRVIEETRPDCVAIELDPKRFFALLQQQKDNGETHGNEVSGGAEKRSFSSQRKLGLRYGFTIYLFGWLQQSLGKTVGVFPGSEMLSAVESAKRVGAKIVLIDKDIEETFRGIMAVPLREKLKLFLGIFAAPFSREKIDLKKVPEEKTIEEAIRYMKKELPSFYKALIGDRNKYMAAWIKRLEGEFDSIVVVVGAGHKKELEKMIRKK